MEVGDPQPVGWQGDPGLGHLGDLRIGGNMGVSVCLLIEIEICLNNVRKLSGRYVITIRIRGYGGVVVVLVREGRQMGSGGKCWQDIDNCGGLPERACRHRSA